MSKPVIRHDGGHINIKFMPASQQVHQSQAVYQRTSVSESPKHMVLERAMKQLERLVGLENVKDFIYEIYAWLYISQKRKEMGLKTTSQSLHMIFKGNPGTGKTTVARILSQMFQDIGVLSKGHLVEVERGDLVGEYIGHTAQKTRETVKKALGGILFIDEAYSLARGGDKDFGKEAIDCLVKAMEDYRDQFILILAGYPQEMDYFLSSNPGLPSRFPIMLEFKNYTIVELLAIADIMAEDREYRLTAPARKKLRLILEQHMRLNPHNFSNARFVRNVIERAIREHAVRMLSSEPHTREELMTLSAEDFILQEDNTYFN
ncbi:stage V sporulation protein K [Caldalkalibacillus uzonensis]|uniref:Stage V sporulation protein K n=1 Tax=Caldalkalibacillus uzonensis TaxID=353224 RepID=A0ABU0CLS6_9BACI|nr:stage V sporulation protein K [Caldalkalibacillus uzonensis]MDQ0337373.1 stage V sporulation protein K [Caldalkalibacillus uzonensis]